MAKRCFVVILASGNGNRFPSEIPKQYLKIFNKTILAYSITIFNAHPQVDEIVVVTNPSFYSKTIKLLGNKYPKIKAIVTGGLTRQESSLKGIQAINDFDGIVLIHDAARPFVSSGIISLCIDKLQHVNAVSTCVAITDTLYFCEDEDSITEIPMRSKYFYAQTPQGFNLEMIRNAHTLAQKVGDIKHTDDASLFLKYIKEKVHIIQGESENIKITHENDMKLAREIVNDRQQKTKLRN